MQAWPGMVKPAHGQGTRKDDIVFNSRGVPLAGASVRVCTMPATGQPCTPLAMIYSDAGLTQAMANPTTTDGMGNYFFYAAPGQYEVEISGPSITTKQIPNVILPSDPSAPTFNSLSTTGGISAFTLNLTGNLTVNGSTTVVGNLASGTLNLTNQGTPPGTASAGTVNLYTKSADKRLYYKDETGTEIGPITNASGAQTNVANNWTAPQSIDADFHTKGPNPSWDVTQFGGYIGANYNTPTTGTIGSGSNALSVASVLDFANGQGVLVLGAGPAPVIATPQAPTVTPIAQTGSTSLSYAVADRDWFGGITPASAVGSTSTGFSAFGLQSYTISGWSATNGVVTITTSAAHNIPTSTYNGGYPQIEIQNGSTNSYYCEGAFTAIAVPSATTLKITRYGIPDSTMNACTGGTLRVLPRVVLKWDSHYTYTVTNAACTGSTATLTVSPGLFGPNGTWMVPWYVNAIIAGASDSHYNKTTGVGGWTGSANTLSYGIVGGSCSGVNTGNLGGTVSLVPGKAVKNHLIYRCSGASCALPANASNYSLVGVAEGNDGYFVDNGLGVVLANIDLGDAPATPSAAATNDYLDTTITSGGGTTSLTLTASATNAVSGAKVFHDNTPNLLATCAAAPSGTYGGNGSHIYIPTPTVLGGQGNAMFPIMANFDTHNCSGVTLDFAAQPWLDGTILMAGGANIISSAGSGPSNAASYSMGTSLATIAGRSYPMLYFEPEQSSNNYFQNLVFLPTQPYQSAFFYDQQMNGDGVVGQRYENVSVNGVSGSAPIVDKAGFGRFWNYGGWSAAGGNFATQRTYLFTQNCGAPAYAPNPQNALSAYITETHGTYNFGTAMVDSCGNAGGSWRNATFNNMLTEGLYGPAWLFNTSPYGISDVTFNNSSYSDPNGGYGTPFYDLTNSSTTGVRWQDISCATGQQTLLETNTGYYTGVNINSTGMSSCAYLGVQNYHYENLGSNLRVDSNYVQIGSGNSYVGYGQIAAPSALASCIASSGGSVPTGSESYVLTAVDAIGNETTIGAACTLSVSSGSQTVTGTFPAPPPGAVGWDVYRNGTLADFNACAKPQFSVSVSTFVDTAGFTCGVSEPLVNGTALNSMNGNSLNAAVLKVGREQSIGQCVSTAVPEPCQALIQGMGVIAVNATSVTVDTTAVTGVSGISPQFDSSLGSALSVTCNTSFQQPFISARSSGTSFTVSVATSVSTNPLCFTWGPLMN